MKITLLSILALGATGVAVAGPAELDSENTIVRSAQERHVPRTTIVRTNVNNPNDVQVFHSDQDVRTMSAAKLQAFAKANEGSFQTAKNEEVKVNELDRDGSTSAWYFGFYAGSWYQPYYSFWNPYLYTYSYWQPAFYMNWNWSMYSYRTYCW